MVPDIPEPLYKIGFICEDLKFLSQITTSKKYGLRRLLFCFPPFLKIILGLIEITINLEPVFYCLCYSFR